MASQSPLIWLQETENDVWEQVMVELVKCRKGKVLKELKSEWSEYKSKLSCVVLTQYLAEKEIHPCRVLLFKNLEPSNCSWTKAKYKIIEPSWYLERIERYGFNRLFVYGFELTTKRYINRRIFTDNGLKYISVTLEFIKDIRNVKKICKDRMKPNRINFEDGIIKALSKLEVDFD